MIVFNTSRHNLHRCLNSLACLFALALAPSAIAQSTAPKGQADKIATATSADQLAREGAEAAGKNDLETARKKLAEAFELKPAYDIAGNLGGVEYGLRRYREAAEHLSYSLRVYPATGNQAQRARTENFLNKALAKICMVNLQGLPAGASALIDGSRSTSLDPPKLFLEPGQHTLSLSAPGYEPTRKPYTCKAGDSATLRMQMKRATATIGPKSDGADSGVPLWPVVVGSGLTLAAGGLGTGMWFAHGSVEEEADMLLDGLTTTTNTTPCTGEGNLPPNCSILKKRREREALLENISIAAFVTGGAAAVATLGYLVGYTVSTGSDDEDADDAQRASTRVRFTPSSVTLDVSF